MLSYRKCVTLFLNTSGPQPRRAVSVNKAKKEKKNQQKQRFIRFKRLKRIKQSYQLHNIKRVMDTGGATVRDMHT